MRTAFFVMKISTPVAVAIIALFVFGIGYFGYQRYQEELTGGGAEVVDSRAYPPYFTEEAWTVQQIGQYIDDLAALVDGRELRTVEATVIPKRTGSASYKVTDGQRKATIPLTDGVWNPATYAKWTGEVLGKVAASSDAGESVVERLLTPDLKTFLALNKAISQGLQADPKSAKLHVDAALLLGTIGLNDYAGCFRDTRPELNRMVAHLAVADALGATLEQPDRKLAEAIRLTLCGQQTDALKLMESLTHSGAGRDRAFSTWVMVLKLRNTDDWRDESVGAAAREKGMPQGVAYEYFRALAQVTTADKAAEFLEEAGIEDSLVHYRIANEVSLSVSNGHRFTSPWIKDELGQAFVGAAAFQVPKQENKIAILADYLDTPAGSPVLANAEGKPVIEVAGRNLFASYHQRHLMEAMNRTYAFLHDMWGVRDQAKQLKDFFTNQLPALRYKPFLMRLTARHDGEREVTNEACFQVIREQTPLVTATLWNRLGVNEDGEKLGLTVPDFHPWFHPEVPEGTAYEIGDRLYDIGVGDEDDVAWIKELRQRAPYSNPLARQLILLENGGSLANAPSAKILEYSTPMVDYEYRAMKLLADSYKENPALYEEWMNKLANLDSSVYLRLAQYFVDRGMDDLAAKYYLIAFEKTDDRVFVANTSRWVVGYLYKKGDVDMATKIAADAAEVYSAKGLATYVWLMEKQGKWEEALKTARDSDERYCNGRPVAELACLLRMKAALPEQEESARHKELLAVTFPEGLQKVDLTAFSGPPTRGVLINGGSRNLKAFGLKNKDVVVALNGYRTDTFAQYQVVRDVGEDEQLQIIAWDGNAYVLKEGKVPRRMFGVDMVDFKVE